MDQVEVLRTIAELGVALAGFASIVTVIGRRQNGRRLGNRDPLNDSCQKRTPASER